MLAVCGEVGDSFNSSQKFVVLFASAKKKACITLKQLLVICLDKNLLCFVMALVL